jgi:hypothetical protein
VFDWMGAFVMVAIGVGVWRATTRGRSWARAVERLPATAVRDLAEGRQVKVVGVVEPGATVAAPLTQRPCVGWTVRAVRVNEGLWVVGRTDRSGACDFVLRDAAGDRVWVRGRRASLVLTDGSPISAGRDQAAGVLRESILEPGAMVTVVGMVRRELDPGGVSIYREAPTRLALDGIPLWILPADVTAGVKAPPDRR